MSDLTWLELSIAFLAIVAVYLVVTAGILSRDDDRVDADADLETLIHDAADQADAPNGAGPANA